MYFGATGVTTVESSIALQVHAIFDAAPFVQNLGITIKQVEPGLCETEIVIRPEMRQQHGYVHAGVVSTIADHTAGGAARSVTGESDVVTVEFKINFVRPAFGPKLLARGRVLNQGKRLIVAQAEVIDSGSEKVVAVLTETLQVIEKL
jgi:uncharacterized protein (TIGR00369 family)